jgi:4-amino-4-deoxy-L-arabinose transferase-like glycosyltransferase
MNDTPNTFGLADKHLFKVGIVVLIIVASVSLWLGISSIPVIDRDEARFAQASRQMAQTGDWVDIRFQDEPRYKKPVGIYWAQAASARVFGDDDIWVFRLPSYLAAVIACGALAWAGAPLVGRSAALLAGLMLPFLFILQLEARVATTDAALLLAAIVAMGALARAWMGKVNSLWPATIFWTALGAGLLIKGPLILLPVAMTVVCASLFDRNVAWFRSLRPGLGVLWTLALAAPWYIVIIIKSDGAFVQQSLVGDLMSKVVSEQESHGAPPGTYLAAFWLSFWPWTVLAPLTAIYAWRHRALRAVFFLLVWIVPMWIILELIPTKLAHYPLLTYPAILLLAGAGVAPILQRAQGLPRIATVLGVVMWGLGLIALIGLSLFAPVQYGNGVSYLTIAGALVSLGLGALAVFWVVRQRFRFAFMAVAATSFAVYTTLFLATLPALNDLWLSPRLAQATHSLDCIQGPVALAGYHEPSAVFLLGRDTILTDEKTALEMLDQSRITAAWIASMPPDADAVEGRTLISGLNYSTGKPVALRLFVAPGVPAPVSVCQG